MNLFMKTMKYTKQQKAKYALDVYKANKNCKPVTYNGVTYKSKTQCMILNDLTEKELNEYLNNK